MTSPQGRKHVASQAEFDAIITRQRSRLSRALRRSGDGRLPRARARAELVHYKTPPMAVIASLGPAGGRPAVDETVGSTWRFVCAVGTEVGFCLVRRSPVASWTRGASMTPTGATSLPQAKAGGGNAPEHAC
jgi:hypothetical protein